MKSASAWDVLEGVDFNYAAEAVHAADGKRSPAAIMLPSRFREPSEEQVHDVAEQLNFQWRPLRSCTCGCEPLRVSSHGCETAPMRQPDRQEAVGARQPDRQEAVGAKPDSQ